MPIAYYGSRISEHITKTPEGYLVCHDVPINRTGIYRYQGYELGLTGNDAEKTFNVLRRDNEVFRPATLASFEGKPVTDEHPAVDLAPDNIQYYGKGHAQNIRRGAGGDSDKTIADLFITDPDLIDQVNNGKREISCGYDFNLVQNENGVYEQRNLAGNHVAVVSAGRAGPNIAIHDSFNERGKIMSTTAKEPKSGGIFKLFRAAAKDESIPDEDLEKAMTAALTAKDADLTPAAPVKPAEEKPAEKEPAKDEVPASNTDALLTELIGLLKPVLAELTKKPAEVEDKDELEDLINPGHEAKEPAEKEAMERETGIEDEYDPIDNESSVTVDPEDIKNIGRDAATAAKIARDALKKAIKDPVAYKAAVKDAATEIRKAYGLDAPAEKNGGYGVFVGATQKAAKTAQDKAPSRAKVIEEAQKGYDARNPHKKKEVK